MFYLSQIYSEQCLIASTIGKSFLIPVVVTPASSRKVPVANLVLETFYHEFFSGFP